MDKIFEKSSEEWLEWLDKYKAKETKRIIERSSNLIAKAVNEHICGRMG